MYPISISRNIYSRHSQNLYCNIQREDMMNAIREILEVSGNQVTIKLPDSFLSKHIEVIVMPYNKSTSNQTSLVDFFMNSPLRGADLDLERLVDYGRDIIL